MADKQISTIIVNDLITGGVAKMLAAQQGVVLKALVDAEATARTAGGGNVKANGSIAFTAPQPGVDATVATDLTTKQQVDAADALRVLKADILDTYAGGVTKVASAERAKDLDARVTAEVAARAAADTGLGNRIAALESRDMAVGNVIRSGNFNGTLGVVEPFRIDVANAVCTPPATGTLTDGVQFGVVLYGTPGATFNCLVDFQTAGQTLHGRTGANANVIITNEVTPFKVRWNATLASWFIVS